MTGLRDVLLANLIDEYGGEREDWTEMRSLTRVETAILDWLRARLASDEVREAVARSIVSADDAAYVDGREGATADDAADAALTAVLAALGQEGTQDAENRDLTASEDENGCGCYSCIGDKPAGGMSWLTIGMTRMIVCSQCGNKRCPHATDHRNECTASNEPGQAGSRYGGLGHRDDEGRSGAQDGSGS